MTNLVVAVVMLASWERFNDAGQLAANGHPFNPQAMTCATWQFPLGTRLHIEDVHNHLACEVIVTDRPARRFKDRVDLSPAAFSKMNGLELGLCDVQVTPE
jgi:rare lipoprotein A (peptidoglycan hydrolase)